MAKNKIKKSTVDQIQKLIQEHGVSGMMDTTEYKNMSERNYLNKLEKENLKTIIALVNDGKSYDEIRFIVEGGEHYRIESDPVEQATVDFMVSQSKFVEAEPPVIIIEGYDDTEDKSEEVTRVEANEAEANDNTVQNESVETGNVVLLKDIINEKKNESNKNDNTQVTKEVTKIIDALEKVCDIKKANENKVSRIQDSSKHMKKKHESNFTFPTFSKFTEGLRMYH